MTSKQNLRSALRASRTEAMRRSIGSMCKSNFCFQLLYSETLPASSTIQNLWFCQQHIFRYLVRAVLVPSLFVQASRVNMAARFAECPQEPFFTMGTIGVRDQIMIFLFQIPNTPELGIRSG